MHEVIPLSLYIHIPWCIQKCPYCDFNSHAIESGFDEQSYVNALLKDLDSQLPLIWGRPVRTVFIGGGTPSLISGSAMTQLLSELRARLGLGPEVEITLEANPGTADSRNFGEYRQAGINRLSLGIQSLHDQRLRELGRIHDAKEAGTAVRLARDAGFENINLDMMFGLPGQSVESAMQELRALLEFEPEHVSYYQLTLEPNTLFYKHPPVLPEEDEVDDIHLAGMEQLASRGYGRYEISAFARNKQDCAHNINYWAYGDYLGIGAGAHSKISSPGAESIRRMVKQKHPQRYMQAAGTVENLMQDFEVGMADRPFEFMMNAMRMPQGVERESFTQRTAIDWQGVAHIVAAAVEAGQMEIDTHTIQPSESGIRFLNDLIARFLPHDHE
ncbi:MAG: radical SAM family heme chaperone HemW [Gammaproteobacteria bacterium]|nr:radical SAM family heme chaperone HemW [Gammaproteobacteria bacterium]